VTDVAPEAPPDRRPLARAIAVGLFAGVLAAALGVVVVGAPLFFLARALEPAGGTGRPFIHNGLLIVVPVSAAVGAVIGPAAGVWYRRGGRLGREDDGYWRS
jgi:uncharacterized RDD family membrane protein YckC